MALGDETNSNFDGGKPFWRRGRTSGEEAPTPEQLQAGEQAGGGTANPSREEKAEAQKAEDNAEKAGWRTKLDKMRSAQGEGARNTAKRRVRGLVITAITSLVVFGIGAIFGLLLPFKLNQIIENLERQVGEVPQYAVERRGEYLMNRFLIIQTLKSGGYPDIDKDRDYIRLGNGVVSTLYSNWRGAKVDLEFQRKGYRLEPIQADSSFGKDRHKFTRPTNFKLYRDGKLVGENMSSKEARKSIRTFTNDITKRRQVLKRFHMRRIYKKYNGVGRWKPFEKTREKGREAYFKKKLAFKKYMVKQTVGRVSANYAKYLDCLLEGGDKCKEIRDGDADGRDNGGSEDQSDDEANAQEEGESKANSAGDDVDIKNLDEDAANLIDEDAVKLKGDGTKGLVKSIQQMGTRRILLSAAGGVGLIHMMFKMEQSVSDGSLSVIQYDNLSQQAGIYGATGQSMKDQIQSGNGDMIDAQIANEAYSGYQKSLTYQSTKASFDPSKRYSEDCNEDGDTTDEGELLEPGETVCPGKRFVQDKTQFTSNPGWSVVASAGDAWRSATGSIIDAISSAFESLMEATNADAVLAWVIDVSGVDSLMQSALALFMNQVLGCSWCGADEGPSFWDATYAGMASNNASLGGGAGKKRADTIGGAYLNNSDLAAIKLERQEIRQGELEEMSMFARYLSPDTTESLTSQFAMAMPTSLSTFSQTSLSTVTNAGSIFGNLTGALTPKSNAAGVVNPFHVVYHGYKPTDPVFTAEEGEGMQPGDLDEQYGCTDKSNRPENLDEMYKPDGLPFPVYKNTDPCLLETAAAEAGSMYFTGEFDKGIDDGTTDQPTGAPGAGNNKIFVIGDSLTVGMRDTGKLADKLKAAKWDPMSIEAVEGKPLKWGIDTVKSKSSEIKAAAPGTVLINLGTNDGGTSGATFSSQVDDMIAAANEAAPGARIFWTNLYGEGEFCAVSCVDFASKFGELNGILDEKSKTKSFTIIPWASSPIAAEYVGDNDVHPYSGYGQMADYVVDLLGAPPTDATIAGLVSPPNLGGELAGGYYKMPDAPNGEYVFSPSTPDSQRCGSRELVDAIYTVAKAWATKYPTSRVRVGDLNATGHQSHKKGVDVDITTEDRSAANTAGDREKSKELGRLFADTGIISKILYNDPQVEVDFDNYASSKDLPAQMQYYSGHADHFHVRILPEYALGTRESCP